MANFPLCNFISFENIIINEENDTLKSIMPHPQDNDYPYLQIEHSIEKIGQLIEPFEEQTRIRVVFHWDQVAHSRKIKCKMQHPLFPILVPDTLVKWTTQFVHEGREHERVLLQVLHQIIELIEKNTQWQNFQAKKSLNDKLVHCLIEKHDGNMSHDNNEEIIKKL